VAQFYRMDYLLFGNKMINIIIKVFLILWILIGKLLVNEKIKLLLIEYKLKISNILLNNYKFILYLNLWKTIYNKISLNSFISII